MCRGVLWSEIKIEIYSLYPNCETNSNYELHLHWQRHSLGMVLFSKDCKDGQTTPK